MFDVSSYLRRIGCDGQVRVDIDTLRKLHKAHLMTIPYNNTNPEDFGDGVYLVDVDEDRYFESAVMAGRGSTCFPLNRLFFRLLHELGYDASLMAAGTAEGWANFGTELDHLFIRVALGGDDWFVDVGYPGPSYIEPFLVSDTVQDQYQCQYRLADREDGRMVLQRRSLVGRWTAVYTFKLVERQWEDWRELENRLRSLRSDPAPGPTDHMQGVLCGRAIENGQVVLKGRRYLTVRDGREKVRTILDAAEHKTLVASIASGEI